MTKKKIFGIMFCLFLILNCIGAFAVQEWDDLSLVQQKNMIKVKQTVKPLDRFTKIASSSINPIVVSDPFASAGTPVLVEYTLSNVGAEFPFNQISLPPDSFALVMAVDREIGFRTDTGDSINVFKKMTGIQKFMYLTSVGFEKGFSDFGGAVAGKTCTFVDIYNNLPKSVQEYVVEKNGNTKPGGVYMWDCLRMSDEVTFEERIEEQCEDDHYSSQCLAKINQRNAHAITNTVVVALASDIPKGQCEAVRGKTTTSWLAKNVIKCGIGEDGLKPQQSVNLRFIITVPSDTPSINDEDLAKSGEIEQDSFTYQASCLNSQFPKQCHTIYGAVFPMATNNLLKIFVDGAKDSFVVGGCLINKLYWGSQTDFEACVESKSSSIDVVGDPIYEGQGTFFVLAPQLDSRITLVLIGAFLSGMLGTSSLAGGKK